MSGKNKVKSDVLTEEEARRILEQPDRRERLGFRDYVILRVMLESGLRKGEIVKLRIQSIIESGGGKALHFESLKKRDKTEKRIIPLVSETVELIEKYLMTEYGMGYKQDTDRPLFRTQGKYGKWGKTGITGKSIDLIVKKYTVMAKIEGKRITPHSFRAANASIMLRKGVDVNTVRLILGHWSLDSTRAYLHSSEAFKREAVEKLEF